VASIAPETSPDRREDQPFSLPALLVIGLEDWDEVERRHQLLIKSLAERHPGTRMLFVEAPARATLPSRLRDVALRRVAENVFRIRTIRPAPERTPQLRRFNDGVEARQLRAALRRLGMTSPILLTKASRAVGLIDSLPAASVVYDLTDDWAAYGRPRDRERIRAEMEALGRRADAVLACSEPLARLAREWNSETHVVPNGVDPPTPRQPMPAALAALPRPIFGYAGTLDAARLDIEMVVAAATARPTASFVFLGPDMLDSPSRTELFSRANIHFLGSRPHREVRNFVEHFDVCLLPHTVSAFTRSLDPLKLYEYLAAGRPVVMTPTGNGPRFAEHFVVASNAVELVRAADHALANDSQEAQERRRLAVTELTWDARARQVEGILAELEVDDRWPAGRS
jgi:glycosyltransferase involved in cell wall biosynthesis